MAGLRSQIGDGGGSKISSCPVGDVAFWCARNSPMDAQPDTSPRFLLFYYWSMKQLGQMALNILEKPSMFTKQDRVTNKNKGELRVITNINTTWF